MHIYVSLNPDIAILASSVAVFGDGASKELIRLNEVMGVGS